MRLRHLLQGRLFAFEAFLADGPDKGRKIAQCLISRAKGKLAFDDGLNILNGYEGHRPTILAHLLPHLPAGHVSYGWAWSLDAVSADDFLTIPGTSGHQCHDVIVHAISLANWTSWDDYYRDISNNVRRNVKRAEQGDPQVTVVRGRGVQALRLIPDLVRMRQQTLDRVDMTHASWRMALSYAANLLVMRDASHIAIARQGNKALAALFGYKSGSKFYYWQGGSIDGSNGAAWKLLTDTVAYWYGKFPQGQFIMGYFDDSLPGYRREGLHRQRESLRKSDYRTQIISFDWDPAKAG